jgi:23S rRNA pseudouridine955/2504/2580 synthase
MNLQKTKTTYVTATEREQGQRVDNFLIRYLKKIPKTHIYRLIRKGEVRVNQKRVRQDSRLELGDIIRVPPVHLEVMVQEVVRLNADQDAWVQQAVIFEHEDFLVVNKPEGVSVHAGSDTRVGLVEALRIYRKDLAFIELVHRLDRATSGLVLLAKKPSALKKLHALIREHEIQKKYHLWVFGVWPKALNKIEVPVEGKASLTTFQILKVMQDMTLLEANLHTGRQHQIRIHAASAKHPVIGDAKYGNFAKNREFVKKYSGHTMFLHARHLKFLWEGTLFNFEAPYPESWLSLLCDEGC